MTDTTAQPWVLTTTGVVTTDDIRIKHLRWVGTAQSQSGDAAILKDKNGKVIWSSYAYGAYNVEDSLTENQRFFPGLTVDTLGSGAIHVYLW